jgi:predicted nucleotidyltransferase
VTGADAIRGVLLAVGDRRPEVRAFWLFGSRADGTPREGSDVDVGVLWEPRQPLEATLCLEEEISRATGLPVDVVDARRAGAFLALEIIRGDRVFCRDEVAADLFELYVLRRAGDLMPFERERQAMLLGVPA